MALSKRVRAAVEQQFAAHDCAAVLGHLGRYAGADHAREVERVLLDVVKLSVGEVDRAAHFVDVALTDYRDILYWAEYDEQDQPKPTREDIERVTRLAQDPRHSHRSRQLLFLLVAIVLGLLAGFLMWPTDDCIRTLVGGAENRPTCTSVVGLPGSKPVAIFMGLVMTVVSRFVLRKVTEKRLT